MSFKESSYAQEVHSYVKQKSLESGDCSVVWTEIIEQDNLPFMGMIQNYSDRTMTTLKANATVPHPVHVILLNFSEEFQRYLTYHIYTFVGLLPVSSSDAEHDHIFDDCNQDIYEKGLGPVIPLYDELPANAQEMEEI